MGFTSFFKVSIALKCIVLPKKHTKWGELVRYAIFQPTLVIYGGQFPQLEEHIVPGSEPASFRQQPLMGFEPQLRGASSFKASRLNHSATEAPNSIRIIIQNTKHNLADISWKEAN